MSTVSALKNTELTPFGVVNHDNMIDLSKKYKPHVDESALIESPISPISSDSFKKLLNGQSTLGAPESFKRPISHRKPQSAKKAPHISPISFNPMMGAGTD